MFRVDGAHSGEIGNIREKEGCLEHIVGIGARSGKNGHEVFHAAVRLPFKVSALSARSPTSVRNGFSS